MTTTISGTTWETAQDILGDNAISLREVGELCHIETTSLPEEQIPFTPDTLEECAESHLLVPMFHVNLQELMDRWFAQAFWKPRSAFSPWELELFGQPALIENYAPRSWVLVRQALTPEPFEYQSKDQQLQVMRYLDDGEACRAYNPRAVVVALAAIVRKTLRGEWPWGAHTLRCSDFVTPWHPLANAPCTFPWSATVRCDPERGICISRRPDHEEDAALILATARKPDIL